MEREYMIMETPELGIPTANNVSTFVERLVDDPTNVTVEHTRFVTKKQRAEGQTETARSFVLSETGKEKARSFLRGTTNETLQKLDDLEAQWIGAEPGLEKEDPNYLQKKAAYKSLIGMAQSTIREDVLRSMNEAEKAVFLAEIEKVKKENEWLEPHNKKRIFDLYKEKARTLHLVTKTEHRSEIIEETPVLEAQEAVQDTIIPAAETVEEPVLVPEPAAIVNTETQPVPTRQNMRIRDRAKDAWNNFWAGFRAKPGSRPQSQARRRFLQASAAVGGTAGAALVAGAVDQATGSHIEKFITGKTEPKLTEDQIMAALEARQALVQKEELRLGKKIVSEPVPTVGAEAKNAKDETAVNPETGPIRNLNATFGDIDLGSVPGRTGKPTLAYFPNLGVTVRFLPRQNEGEPDSGDYRNPYTTTVPNGTPDGKPGPQAVQLHTGYNKPQTFEPFRELIDKGSKEESEKALQDLEGEEVIFIQGEFDQEKLPKTIGYEDKNNTEAAKAAEDALTQLSVEGSGFKKGSVVIEKGVIGKVWRLTPSGLLSYIDANRKQADEYRRIFIDKNGDPSEYKEVDFRSFVDDREKGETPSDLYTYNEPGQVQFFQGCGHAWEGEQKNDFPDYSQTRFRVHIVRAGTPVAQRLRGQTAATF